MELLLLPGLMCDAAVWTPVLPRLEAVARCRIPDYGSATSLPEMAARVLAAAPPAFALAGHSMGGRVALEIVRRAPERIDRLALLDTGFRALPRDSAGDDETAGRRALLAIARERGVRAMAREWARPMVHPARRDDEALVGPILDMFARHSTDDFAAQIDALLARPDATAVLRSLACPTLVLCGRQDGWAPPSQHEEMAALIPGATLAVIEGCGHMAPMERPHEVAEAMLAWLGAPLDSDPRAETPAIAT
ncbi:MAG TPA: alpha/beta hydrolase [Casimicrobiaceae bacterium]|nr:alpha/beta hydrolase [Casimicrobiaceae bacterium]